MEEVINDILDILDLLDDKADSSGMNLKLIVADPPVTESPWYHQSERFNYSGKRGVRY
jgi:hypothetical protein